uniref:Uncharacterized protein n=1 Tax=Arundo donax TaxID=35708 RepID=A0A0A9A706_ARUDO
MCLLRSWKIGLLLRALAALLSIFSSNGSASLSCNSPSSRASQIP